MQNVEKGEAVTFTTSPRKFPMNLSKDNTIYYIAALNKRTKEADKQRRAPIEVGEL